MTAPSSHTSLLSEQMAHAVITPSPIAQPPSPKHQTTEKTVDAASTGHSKEVNAAAATTEKSSQVKNGLWELEERIHHFVLPKVQPPPKEEFEPVQTFVANALRSQLDPSVDEAAHKAFRAVLSAIRKNQDREMLTRVFLALRTADNGSTLHALSGSPTKHAQLLHFLLRFNPFQDSKNDQESSSESKTPTTHDGASVENYSLADAYLQLVLSLVSANSVFLLPAMTSLWKALIQLPTKHEPPIERVLRFHGTLKAMTELCPKGKTELFSIMTSSFPFRTRPEREIIWCFRQSFAVLSYLPAIRGQVLQFVIDKSLEMDVEIKVDDGGQVSIDTEKEEKLGGAIFDLEMENHESNDITNKGNQPPQQEMNATVDEMADKLDAVMHLVFQFLEKNGKNRAGAARELYSLCLPAFESSILITHRSKFVQFILFYLCGLEKEAVASPNSGFMPHEEQQHATLYRVFSAKLLEVIFDPYRATVVRQSATCYLASFISRARFVGADTICESICALLRWADAYIASMKEHSFSAADIRDQCDLHSLFYTICQASFYVMCFRGAEAMRFYNAVVERKPGGNETAGLSSDHDLLDVDGIDLHQIDIGSTRWASICSHELRPLSFCLETVRSEFLRMAEAFNLLDLELRNRLFATDSHVSPGVKRKGNASSAFSPVRLKMTRIRAGVGGMGRGANPLDSFFPFDPYLLRRSHNFVDRFYKLWGDPLEEDDGSERDGNDDDDDALVATDCSESDDSDDEDSISDEDVDERMDFTPPGNPSPAAASIPVPREPWTDTLKRNRAPSIENGSW